MHGAKTPKVATAENSLRKAGKRPSGRWVNFELIIFFRITPLMSTAISVVAQCPASGVIFDRRTVAILTA